MSDKEKVHVRIDKDKSGKVEYGIQHAAEVSPVLKEAEDYRRIERESGFKRGSDMRRVASIPVPVVMEIKDKHGIDMFNLKPDEGPRLLQIINQEYPLLKTTEMKFGKQLRGN